MDLLLELHDYDHEAQDSRFNLAKKIFTVGLDEGWYPRQLETKKQRAAEQRERAPRAQQISHKREQGNNTFCLG